MVISDNFCNVLYDTLSSNSSFLSSLIYFDRISNEELRKYVKVETGKFGAEMTVNITNDGPITIMLER